MKRILPLLCLLLLNIHGALSQCKTFGNEGEHFISTPWFGDNAYLTNFLAARGYVDDGLNYRTACPIPRYQLPVRLVVFRDGANSPGSAISQVDAVKFLQEANLLFEEAGTGISFYLQQFEYIADDDAHSGIDGMIDLFGNPNYLSSIEVFRLNRVDGMINVYFVKDTSPSETATGMAAVPISKQIPVQIEGALWSCWVKTHNGNQIIDSDNIIKTLAHELGHVLGNSHTHHPGSLSLFNNDFDKDNAKQSSCAQEVVSRTEEVSTFQCLLNRKGIKCEVNGDGLCDTKADPNTEIVRSGDVMLKGVTHSPSCAYLVPNYDADYIKDTNNEIWTPPTRNIMSYSNSTCLEEFSNMQIGIMWDRIENRFMDYFQPEYSGASQICYTGSSITIDNAPPTMDISWSVHSSSLIHSTTLGGTGRTAYIKAKSSSSQGWATVSFFNSNNCEYFISSVDVWVGKPITPTGITVASPQWNGQNQTCPNTLLELVAVDNQNTPETTYNWSVQGASIQSGQGTESIFVKVPNHSGTRNLTFAVRAQNSCGSSSWRTLYGTSNPNYGGCGGGDGGGGMFIIGPNPNDGEFDLLFKDPEAMESYYKGNGKAFRVTIMNLSGEEVFHGALNKNGLHINLKHAPKGIYTIKITGKDFEDTARLLIE